MASRNKKTTMAKLAREHKLRQRRVDKQARKNARKQAAADGSAVDGADGSAADGETSAPEAADNGDEAVTAAHESVS